MTAQEAVEACAKLAEDRAKDAQERSDRLAMAQADYRLVVEQRLVAIELLDLARHMRERVK